MGYPKCIMVVGNGGRECAIATALLESAQLERLIITPANWGIVDRSRGRVSVLDIAASDSAGLIAAAREHNVDLVVIGPEDPLVAGLADELRSAGIITFGPGKDCAQLEGSKAFAKDFMRRCAIPTAKYSAFSDHGELVRWIERSGGPLVLKADGLAAGKGVVVCETTAEALEAADRMMLERQFGDAGSTVLVEERLSGREISFTCLIAGDRAEVLPPASDYKRLLDGDQGPNTGGMGNMCPTPYASDEVVEEFCSNVLARFMRGLKSEGLDYRGILFVGAMLTSAGLMVIEFNVRFGDPEAEVVLPMCEADWPALLYSVAQGELPASAVRLRDGACVAVVLASENYPYGKSRPAEIEGLTRVAARGLLAGDPPAVAISFSGVTRERQLGENGAAENTYVNYFEAADTERFIASGGRVLTIAARAADLSLARRLAYEVAGNIRFDGMQLRTDIAKLR